MSKATEHNNVVIFDDRGIPSIMCRFERPKDAAETPAIFKIGERHGRRYLYFKVSKRDYKGQGVQSANA